MSLPPVPVGYDSWNQYIAEQGAIVAAAQGLTLQQGKASVKLLSVATPGRIDPESPDFMPYNIFTTWAQRTVAPEIGRPWRDGTPQSGAILVTDAGDFLVTDSGLQIITQ